MRRPGDRMPGSGLPPAMEALMNVGVVDGGRWRRAAAVLILGSVGVTDAAATTLLEAERQGGEFSGDWRSPTVVTAGIDHIAGTGGLHSDDYFVFVDLPSGAQSVVFDFSAPAGIGYSYSAGGTVLFDTKPFAYEWAGTWSATVQLDHQRRRQSVTVTLPDTFRGKLFVALNFTHGEGIEYSVSVPSNALATARMDAEPARPGRAPDGLRLSASGAAGRPMRRSAHAQASIIRGNISASSGKASVIMRPINWSVTNGTMPW